MKIVTSTVLKNLSGEPMKLAGGNPATFGKTLASVLASSRIEHKYSKDIYQISQKFFNDEVVELDRPWYQLLMGVLQLDKTQNVLIIGQLMDILEKESMYLDEPKKDKKTNKKK